jgi:hypothetical protein
MTTDCTLQIIGVLFLSGTIACWIFVFCFFILYTIRQCLIDFFQEERDTFVMVHNYVDMEPEEIILSSRRKWIQFPSAG